MIIDHSVVIVVVIVFVIYYFLSFPSLFSSLFIYSLIPFLLSQVLLFSTQMLHREDDNEDNDNVEDEGNEDDDETSIGNIIIRIKLFFYFSIIHY